MVEIKGIDNGYAFTKDNERRIFKSAYSLSDNVISGTNHIIIDGVHYFVGNGQMTCDVDKTNTTINKVCTVTNLAMSGEKEYYIVAGLPIGSYKTQKDVFRQSILKYNECDVRLGNGRKFGYIIKDAYIFPQGAAALYSSNFQGDCIIVDIGGLTIDVAYIEYNFGKPSISKSDTWFKGMRILYSSIIEHVNNRFKLRLETHQAEKILLEGLSVKGVKQDMSFLQGTYADYINPILDELELKYPTDTVPVKLIGGGSVFLQNAFKRRFSVVDTIQDSQFSNALGYYNIGKNVFANR